MATTDEELVGLLAEYSAEADAGADDAMVELELKVVEPKAVEPGVGIEGLKLDGGVLQVDDKELAALLAKPTKSAESGEALSEVEQSLVVIQNSQAYITRMEQSLANLVDAVNRNDSILSKLSASWGRMGLFGQITTGAVLTVPAVVAGLVASIPGLVAIGLSGATVYTGAGFLLQDHHSHESSRQGHVKDAVVSVTTVFSCVIDALAQIAHQLAHQVTRLTGENEKFAANNTELMARIETLTGQVEAMAAENGQFKDSNTKLEGLVEELGSTKLELETQAKQAQDRQATLAQMLTHLSVQAAESEGAHGELIKKLQAMATKQDGNYMAICNRMQKAEKARDDALLQLKTLARQYATLNAQNASNTTRLEAAVGRAEALTGSTTKLTDVSAAEVMKSLGLLAEPATKNAVVDNTATRALVPPVGF